jgi:histidinol-phosphate aminotransferase
VIKLASNEGPFGPFPAALEALARTSELNRYPDGGGYRLRQALADRHGVGFDEIVLGAGADGVIDYITQATLDPGDEVVFGWPSFPSYLIYARRLGAVPRPVPLGAGDRYDLEALLGAVGPRTKLVCISHPNNPTGTMNTREELDSFFDRVPDHVLTVLDQAYYEYIDHPNYPDGIAVYAKRGRRVIVLRTFSKIFGLAGLRIGYGVAAEPIATSVVKVRRPFDLSTPAQEAALASLDDPAEVERRRRLNATGRETLAAALAEHYRVAGPAVANFLFADVGTDARELADALLREGVIVRPLAGFGAPNAIRVTVGTPDENTLFADALGRIRAGAAA